MSRPVASVATVGLVLVAALSACGGDGSDDLGVVRTDPFRMTGAFDGETSMLVPCTSTADQIRLEWTPLDLDLTALHADLVPQLQRRELIFLDIFGIAIEDGDDVSFEVLDVFRGGWEDWGCDWRPSVQPLVLAMSGTEPDWSLQVGGDSTVVLSRPEGGATGSWTLLEGSLAAGWEAEGVIEGMPWALEVYEEPCRNAMTGGYTHLVATFSWREQEWTGCGFVGDVAEVS